MLGLPFAFASHFAPDAMMQALKVYRADFQPSRQLDHAYAMLGVNVFAADTDRRARRHFTSLQQAFINLRRGTPGPVPPPIDDIDAFCSPSERAGVDHALVYSFVGSSETIERDLRTFIAAAQPDELMISGHFHDHAARLRSFEIAAEVREKLKANPPP